MKNAMALFLLSPKLKELLMCYLKMRKWESKSLYICLLNLTQFKIGGEEIRQSKTASLLEPSSVLEYSENSEWIMTLESTAK